MLQAKEANTDAVKKELKRERENDTLGNSRRSKRAQPTAGSVYLELNDDDTFTQIVVANPRITQEPDVIALD